MPKTKNLLIILTVLGGLLIYLTFFSTGPCVGTGNVQVSTTQCGIGVLVSYVLPIVAVILLFFSPFIIRDIRNRNKQ